MDALEFLKMFDDNSVDGVLYDPPYSPRQVSECYKHVGYNVTQETTRASFWGNHKKEISRIVKQGGKVITFGWNSGGIGMKYGFEIQHILLVPHGGWHNDTICTVEIKKIKKGKGINKMAKYEIKQEFIGTINDVEINDKYIYQTMEYILDLIDTRFGEVYNDKFIKDLKETIRKISDSTDSFSFTDLENDFYYAITNKDVETFEDVQFDDYYYAEYLNERIKNGEYLKTKK